MQNKTNQIAKNAINKRNRLLKQFKKRPTTELKSKISNLNYEIRTHFFGQKRFQVRKGILPGNSKSLWHAVKLAKNQGPELIPPNMKYHGIEVTSDDIAEVFAGFFDKKVVGIVESTSVDPGVYSFKTN